MSTRKLSIEGEGGGEGASANDKKRMFTFRTSCGEEGEPTHVVLCHNCDWTASGFHPGVFAEAEGHDCLGELLPERSDGPPVSPSGVLGGGSRQASPSGNDKVVGRCPMGCGETLFLGSGGYVTCSWVKCPQPDAASTLLEGAGTARERIASALWEHDFSGLKWRGVPDDPETDDYLAYADVALAALAGPLPKPQAQAQTLHDELREEG